MRTRVGGNVNRKPDTGLFMATDPSESEPTFTPPGSVAPAPAEIDFLGDEEIIIRQEQGREAWADQQDQPDEVVTANLLDLEEEEGDGAAAGAPLAAEPVVEGPVNYNIFHGEESPPRIIETKKEDLADTPGAASGARRKQAESKKEVSGAASSTQGAPVVEPEYRDEEADYEPEGEQEEPPEAPQEGAASGTPEEEAGEPFQVVQRRGARGAKGGLYIKQKAFVKQFHQVGFPALHG